MDLLLNYMLKNYVAWSLTQLFLVVELRQFPWMDRIDINMMLLCQIRLTIIPK
jgi:uncharacterized membrane protein